MDRLRLDNIIATVSRLLAPAGYECIEAEWVGDGRILRLFIDRLVRMQSAADVIGVNLEDCVKASKLLEEVPELDEMVAGGYTLEVSSPGVERPLRKRLDFERYIGETVEVKLTEKVQERRHGSGKLVHVASSALAAVPGDAQDAVVTLETKRGPWSFPLASLQRANLVHDWGQHR